VIGYEIDLAQIEGLVDQEKNTWRGRAARVADESKAAGKLTNDSGFWSEIKGVFIKLQRHKCMYCERKIGHGKVEWDVEHFRPKDQINAWPAKHHLQEQPYLASCQDKFGGDSGGYFLLAYNLANYGASCKYCNSTLKWVYFPILGTRQTHTDDPGELQSERPLIIFPIGTSRPLPEELIVFDGATPMPVSKDKTSYDYLRARVTIDLLRLEDRDDVLEDRAEVLAYLWVALITSQGTDPVASADAETVLRHAVTVGARQCSCARSFVVTFRTDRDRAKSIFDAATEYLRTR
jgi:hypothetical protein